MDAPKNTDEGMTSISSVEDLLREANEHVRRLKEIAASQACITRMPSSYGIRPRNTLTVTLGELFPALGAAAALDVIPESLYTVLDAPEANDDIDGDALDGIIGSKSGVCRSQRVLNVNVVKIPGSEVKEDKDE